MTLRQTLAATKAGSYSSSATLCCCLKLAQQQYRLLQCTLSDDCLSFHTTYSDGALHTQLCDCEICEILQNELHAIARLLADGTWRKLIAVTAATTESKVARWRRRRRGNGGGGVTAVVAAAESAAAAATNATVESVESVEAEAALGSVRGNRSWLWWQR